MPSLLERIWSFFPLLLVQCQFLPFLLLGMGGVLGVTATSTSAYVVWWCLLLVAVMITIARDYYLGYHLHRGLGEGCPPTGNLYVGHAFSVLPTAMVVLLRAATMISLVAWRLDDDLASMGAVASPAVTVVTLVAILEQTLAMLDESVRIYVIRTGKEAEWLTAVLFGGHHPHPGRVIAGSPAGSTSGSRTGTWTSPLQHFQWHATTQEPVVLSHDPGQVILDDVTTGFPFSSM